MYAEIGANIEAIISIGILLVNDDQTCQNSVTEVLQYCKHQVLHTGTVYDALHAIWENRDRLDLVITNAHKLSSEGLAIIENIKQKLEMNVLLIENDERIEPKGRPLSFSAYVLNDLSVKGFDILLGEARRAENAAVAPNKASSLTNDAETTERNDNDNDNRNNHRASKKPRVTWTAEMHGKFLDAIERLGGYLNAVPKRIVEVMGVPDLTRENVASHLQKYRESMKSTRNELGALDFSTLATFQANLASFPHRIPTLRESNLHYTTASPDLSFGSISTGFSHISDHRNGLDKLRNTTQSRERSSLCSKFVGYRFEGNSIYYGPVKNINNDCILQHSSFRCHQPVSTIQEQGLLSTCSPKIEEDVRINQHPHHQDLSFSSQEENGNDFVNDILEQHFSPPSPLPQLSEDLEDIFNQSRNDDEAMINGTENECDQFDFPELDDSFFDQDD